LFPMSDTALAGLLALVAILSHAQPSFAASVSRIVAVSGTPAVGAPAGQPYGYMQFATIDATGNVAFSGGVEYTNTFGENTSDSAIWAEKNGVLNLVARQNNPAPGMPGGQNYYDVAVFRQSRIGGRVAFQSSTRSDPSSFGFGIWSETNGLLQLVARNGVQAPGTSSGSTFNYFYNPSVNSSGNAAFQADLTVGSGGVTADNSRGVWGGGDTLHLVARKGSQAPGTPTGAVFNVFGDEDRRVLINDAGQVALIAVLKNGVGGVTSANDVGIWLETGGTLTLKVRAGSAIPSLPGVSFNSLYEPMLNNAGQLAFIGASAQGNGLWTEGGGSLHLAVSANAAPAGVATGGSIDYFESVDFNDAGKTAFIARLTSSNGSIVNGNDSGLWVETNNGLELIAREGSHAPGTPSGAVFDEACSGCGNFALNATGQVAFRGDLLEGVGGVTSSNDVGIWATNRTGALQLIARTGEQIDLDFGPGTNLKTIQDLSFLGGPGGTPGKANVLNDKGQLVYIAQFTDYTYGVFVSNAVAGLTGDFNNDGVVNAADYVVWRNFRNTATVLPNDNSPGVVDTADFNDWRANFGSSQSGGGSTAELTAVPEPTAVLLVGAILVATNLLVGRPRRLRRADFCCG